MIPHEPIVLELSPANPILYAEETQRADRAEAHLDEAYGKHRKLKKELERVSAELRKVQKELIDAKALHARIPELEQEASNARKDAEESEARLRKQKARVLRLSTAIDRGLLFEEEYRRLVETRPHWIGRTKRLDDLQALFRRSCERLD